MIFGKHNFTSNFLNAIGYQDEWMADQIIIDEVARLIVEDKKNVVEALRKGGVNATYKDNNDLIKAMLVKEIEDENPDIIRFVSDKIVQNQLNSDTFKEIVKKHNATGENKSAFVQNVGKVLQDENVKDALGTLISTGVKKVFSKTSTSKTSNDTQLTERLKINEMQAAAKKKSNKKTILVLGGVAFILLVAGAVFYFTRKKYGNGGIVTGSTMATGNTVTSSAGSPEGGM